VRGKSLTGEKRNLDEDWENCRQEAPQEPSFRSSNYFWDAKVGKFRLQRRKREVENIPTRRGENGLDGTWLVGGGGGKAMTFQRKGKAARHHREREWRLGGG